MQARQCSSFILALCAIAAAMLVDAPLALAEHAPHAHVSVRLREQTLPLLDGNENGNGNGNGGTPASNAAVVPSPLSTASTTPTTPATAPAADVRVPDAVVTVATVATIQDANGNSVEGAHAPTDGMTRSPTLYKIDVPGADLKPTTTSSTTSDGTSSTTATSTTTSTVTASGKSAFTFVVDGMPISCECMAHKQASAVM